MTTVDVRHWRLGLVGFGSVGRALARLLLEAMDDLEANHGISLAVGLIATGPGGALVATDGAPAGGGLDLQAALRGELIGEMATGRPSALEAIPEAPIDVVIEMSWFDPIAAEPATSHLRAAFLRGAHAITTNKGPIAMYGPELRAEAAAAGVAMRYEATLMSCLPVLALREGAIPFGRVLSFEATPNSTCNYVLDAMATGRSLAEAVAEAQRLGLAEADPTQDLSGGDAALKAAILAQCLLDRDVRVGDVERVGLEIVSETQLAEARAAGQRIRLVARGSVGNDPIRVRPERVSARSALGSTYGFSQALAVETEYAGRLEICLVEPRIAQTAYAVLMDLIAINRDVAAGRLRPPASDRVAAPSRSGRLVPGSLPGGQP